MGFLGRTGVSERAGGVGCPRVGKRWRLICAGPLLDSTWQSISDSKAFLASVLRPPPCCGNRSTHHYHVQGSQEDDLIPLSPGDDEGGEDAML